MSISIKDKDVYESKHQPTIPETSSFLNIIRRQLSSMKFTHRCKTTQVHALNPAPDHHLTINSILSNPNDDVVSSPTSKSFLPYGLPTTHLLEPAIDPHLNPVDFVDSLSSLYRRIEATSDDDASKMSNLYVEQHSLLCALGDPKPPVCSSTRRALSR